MCSDFSDLLRYRNLGVFFVDDFAVGGFFFVVVCERLGVFVGEVVCNGWLGAVPLTSGWDIMVCAGD